ncbi:MAG: sialate O-acetylesterase [Verrucomicrobiota bacterium]
MVLQLPPIFSDYMVLQAGRILPIWGISSPEEPIDIQLRSNAGSVILQEQVFTEESGKWRCNLPAVDLSDPNSPLILHIKTSRGEEITFNDVLVGEVWLCSGQSNMTMSVENARDGAREVSTANFPLIREFQAPQVTGHQAPWPQASSWRICSPEHVGSFSAVGYSMARRLHQELQVPVGIIHSSWGGSSCEAWTRRDSMLSHSLFSNSVHQWDDKLEKIESALTKGIDPAKLPLRQTDPGNSGEQEGLADPAYDDDTWEEINQPGAWEYGPLGDIDGVVWFRKRIKIPASWIGKDLSLNLGRLDDVDITYVNGSRIGETNFDTPNPHDVARKYTVPGQAVQSGELLIAIRIFDHYGEGGMTGHNSEMYLVPIENSENEQKIPLDGPWRVFVRHSMSPFNLKGYYIGDHEQKIPSGLYDGMIVPWAPFAIRGVAWYQGEANAGRAEQYKTLLPMMIKDWRTLWNQEGSHFDFPFLIVQLASYLEPSEEPSGSTWAEQREAQHHVAATVKNADLITAIDLGEADDIHPKNKQDVGLRLANLALKRDYGKSTLVAQGPFFERVAVDEAQLILHFRTSDSPLSTLNGEALASGFALLTSDDQWRWALGKIKDNTVIISVPEGLSVRAIRYAWSSNPMDGKQGMNLTNSDRLPAFPFHHDIY